jgi:hypothetical protein
MSTLRCLDAAVVLRDRALHMNLQSGVVHIVPLKTERLGRGILELGG